MAVADIDWIPSGTRFGVHEMTFFAGKGTRELDDVLEHIDLIVTGPHATAAFPAEMQPYVDGGLTRRLQHDFSDVSTSPVARQWAEVDPKVLYIEDPHPRAVRDANRPRPTDLLATIREAFDRLDGDPGGRPSLAGVDAVRPVTFGYLPVLRRPGTDAEWNELEAAFLKAGAQGIDEYERLRDDLIGRVLEAKLRRLAGLDPASVSVSEWNSATSLNVLSIHDTMNHTARPDGAICVERKPEDRLPEVVALSNRGDDSGDIRLDPAASIRTDDGVPTMDPALLRSIGTAYRHAFDAWAPGDVAYNRPYIGGHETTTAGPWLRDLGMRAVVRPDAGPARWIRLGAWQNEFLREFLLGSQSTAAMSSAGADWPGVPDDRVAWLAERLTFAHDLVRRWGTALERTGRA